MINVFVPDIPEFSPLIEGARRVGCTIRAPQSGYWRIEASSRLTLNRKELGLGPALWNSALNGGFQGKILEYGRDQLVLTDEA